MFLADDEQLDPWGAYRRLVTLQSRGRVMLTVSFWEYCMMRFGLSYDDIADAFVPDGSEQDRASVTAGVTLIGGLFLEGVFPTWARPVGGGETVAIPAEHWELDDLSSRFATGMLCLDRPFEPSAAATHVIFVDRDTHQSLLDACCIDIPGYDRLVAVRERVEIRREASPGAVATDAGKPIEARSGWDGEAIMRIRDVVAMTGLSRATIYDRVSKGMFPPPRDLGGRLSGWMRSEVEDWMADRAHRR